MSAAWIAGTAAALLQLAGALKASPPVAALPVDLTLLALLVLGPALAVLAATRRWRLDPALALPLAAALLLPLWLVLAGSWSASRAVAAAKLPEVVLLGPVMLLAGLLVGADAAARRAFCGATLAIGFVLALMAAAGVLGGWALLVAPDPEQARVNYQLAGLGLAMAATLAALRAVERGAAGGLPWLLLSAALGAAALVPGGRMALLALGCGVALAPGLRLLLEGRRGAAAAWLGAALLGAAGLALVLLLDPEAMHGLRTVERLTGEAAGVEARLHLWAAALDWAGRAAPFGLGTGGFAIAAGHGERRGLYPHNHALEMLAEAGLPGFLLWLGAFGGALLAAIRLAPGVAPGRAARIAALVLPVALSVMVSTDIGNRMAWFALGLALSLGVASGPARAAVARPWSPVMYERWGKRAFDLAVAALLLLLLAPALLAIALAVRLRLGRPVLFVQLRAGRGGRPFRLLKFRSMAAGREPDAERMDGFGRLLRASGLDELPQLLNVLRGEMSLVGPRPLPIDYLPHYSPRQAHRFRVRPGIAGPGVAAGRNALAWTERLELGAAYADARPTLRGDLRLILATLRVWLTGRGTHAPGHATMPPFRGRDESDG